MVRQGACVSIWGCDAFGGLWESPRWLNRTGAACSLPLLFCRFEVRSQWLRLPLSTSISFYKIHTSIDPTRAPRIFVGSALVPLHQHSRLQRAHRHVFLYSSVRIPIALALWRSHLVIVRLYRVKAEFLHLGTKRARFLNPPGNQVRIPPTLHH